METIGNPTCSAVAVKSQRVHLYIPPSQDQDSTADMHPKAPREAIRL